MSTRLNPGSRLMGGRGLAPVVTGGIGHPERPLVQCESKRLPLYSTQPAQRQPFNGTGGMG